MNDADTAAAPDRHAEALTAAAPDLFKALDALTDWTSALAIAGAVTPEAWVALDKLHERACRALDKAGGLIA